MPEKNLGRRRGLPALRPCSLAEAAQRLLGHSRLPGVTALLSTPATSGQLPTLRALQRGVQYAAPPLPKTRPLGITGTQIQVNVHARAPSDRSPSL